MCPFLATVKGTPMSNPINGHAAGQPARGVVTTDDVRRWRADKDELAAKIHQSTQDILMLNRKLEAAAILFPDLEEGAPFELRAESATEPVAETQSVEAPRAPSLIDEISVVMAAANRPLAPIEIRDALTKRGHQLSQNYLYTAIKRAAEKGKIHHYGKKYRLPRTSSPQGETGGVAPPVS
jgi:hypothetical protein